MKKLELVCGTRRRFFAALGAALLLIAAGLAALYRTIGSSREQMLAGYDHQVMGIAEAVDRDAASTLEYYGEALEYVVGRRGFLQAEQQWLAGGDAGPLRRRMEENLVAQAEAVRAVLALRDGAVALSTNGRVDYAFPQGDPCTGTRRLMRCVDGSGNNYFAMLYRRGDVCYAALLCVRCLYQEIMGDALVSSDNDLYLMDTASGLMLRQADGQVQAGSIPQPGEPGYEAGPAQLLACQQSSEAQMYFYKARDAAAGVYTARMAALPARGEYHYFTVGVVGNYDDILQPQRRVAMGFLGYGGVAVCGILLLVGLLLQGRRRNEAARQELAALRERNAEMERLNQQTRELAHHQRLEMLGTMTSGIAHEINNLLTPIMGYSIMVMEKLPPEATEVYDNMLAIYDSSRKAKEIIARLSSLSRKNSALANQPLSPDALLRHALEAARPVQPEAVEVCTRLDCGTAQVYGNEVQLSQMLLNLILNAFQAMEAQGGRLTASAWAEGEQVFLCVEDTGPGIPEELRERVFEPFFTTKGSKGTGLGLAIVRQMAEENQGSVRLDSAPGQGAAFTVQFPRWRAETEKA